MLFRSPIAWENYKLGVPKKKKYKLLLNSAEERFGGAGGVMPKEIMAVKEECDYRNYSITLDLPPYAAAVFVF